MGRLRIRMSPGIMRNPDTVLEIRVLAPRYAKNVRLVLVEMDTWGGFGDRSAERSDWVNNPIATFTGSIERRRFCVDQVKQSEVKDKAPVLKVRFHGDETVHEVRIPDAGLDEEGGEIEIGIEARAEVKVRRRYRTVEYKSHWPVFYRNYGPEGAQERPVVTFIADRDAYARVARVYWKHRADGIVRRSSVESILDYITKQERLKRYGEGKWGDINIVAHGTAWYWLLRLVADRKFRPHHIDRGILKSHGGDKRLKSPADDQADGTTRIILRSCMIGQNQKLLDQIRTLFGGKAYVYAPKYYQYYHAAPNLRRAREFFGEPFFVYVPGSRSPRLKECMRLMQKRYWDSGIKDDEWRNLLRGRGDCIRKDQTERFSFLVNFGQQVPPRDKDELLAILRRHWPGDYTVWDTAVDDWKWRFKRQAQGSQAKRSYRVIYIGCRRRVEVRRTLRDPDGSTIAPNINEPLHYGRSPSWDPV